jgi:redox-sensitive bicupin YhaK (pirin superfamily)
MRDAPPPGTTELRDGSASIELVIAARPRDLGGFVVRRVLPSTERRMIGPFIFFDHLGPVLFAPGAGIDVRPHPHIGLATVTYLFEGEIVHRDSLGSQQRIRPGDVNWMLAGRGIAHSERTGEKARQQGARVHGIQSWVALPSDREENEPTFEHHDAVNIPRVRRGGATLDVLAGTGFGVRSPVTVLSPSLYVHAKLEPGSTLVVEEEHDQRAIYVVEGEVVCEERTLAPGTMAVLRPAVAVSIGARAPARVMIVGGAKLEGERHIFWNFVSSSKTRIEQAKDDWKAERFPKVPGDEVERIPLPAP